MSENQITKTERALVHDDGPTGYLMDSARFEHAQRVSALMAASSLLPDHLRHERGNPKAPPLPDRVVQANCFRVFNQAMRWQMDPFAIVDETYVVGGKLAYQGKLVAAVVNARAGLDGRLNYTFSGSGDARAVKVSGCFRGEGGEVREVELKLKDARTQNQMWKSDPDQKLIYSAVVKWARRHCPEVVLGVLTDDDLDRMRESRLVEDKHRIVDLQPMPLADDDPDMSPASKADSLADQLAAKNGTGEEPRDELFQGENQDEETSQEVQNDPYSREADDQR